MAYTRIEPAPDNGCEGCAALAHVRVFCVQCRPQCPWCQGKGYRVRNMSWVKCTHERSG